jgi:NADH dehydrogenase
MNHSSNGKRRIVILGGGFAGAYCASSLEEHLGSTPAEVLLIDRHNYFIFYPLLVEAGTGSLQPRHAVVPIRQFLRRTKFLMANVTSIDLHRREVVYRVGEEPTRTISYDHLVLALGSITNLPPVPGLKEYAYEVKSLADALTLRDRAIEVLERANALDDPARARGLLHFAVVGGNYTGVEVAGEFDVYLKEAARKYPNLDPGEVKITLIDQNDRLLGTLDDELSDYAQRHLSERGVDLRLKERAVEIRPDGLVLSSGATVSASTVIWCAGIAAPPMLKELGLPTDKRGYVLCDPEMRVQGFDTVWAIGDCAVNPDPQGNPYPATAQLAVLEGGQLGENIARVLRNLRPLPCTFRSKGMMAAFGSHDAVAKVFRFRVTGFAAWFLWRSYYLLRMPGLARKFRVAFDWTLDLLFGRDYVELGVHRVVRAATTPGAGDRSNSDGNDRDAAEIRISDTRAAPAEAVVQR